MSETNRETIENMLRDAGLLYRSHNGDIEIDGCVFAFTPGGTLVKVYGRSESELW